MKDQTKKKKFTRRIVRGEPMLGVEPVQSSHFEPSVTSIYFPSGQRILSDAGKELTFDNYKKYFESKDNQQYLQKIEKIQKSDDAKKESEEKLKEFTNAEFKYSILFKILTTGIITVIFSLPILVFISIGFQNIVKDKAIAIGLYIFFLLIIMIPSWYYSKKFKIEKERLKKEFDTTYFRYIELLKKEEN